MEYHYISTLKSSPKGDIQLVAGDGGRLYVRRYREISTELFERLRGITSPLVERFTEISRDERGCFIISEYIEGEPADSRKLSEKEVLRALTELCDAVSALHRVGIIHRDIKPTNIIFAENGHIRLIDPDSARLTIEYKRRDTELLGTVGYAAPEQYGFMQSDRRTDIYAFGVTMRELLGDCADKPAFRRIIKHCTEFDPDRRYRDIRAVKRALKLARMPFLPPLTVTAAATAAAVMILLVRKAPTTAPMGIVRLSETSEISVTIETEGTSDDSAETLPTAEPAPTAETPPTTEPDPTTESTPAETTATVPTTQTAVTASAPSLTEEPPAEVTATVEENHVPTVSEAEPTAEETTAPETTATSPPEEPAPERTPLILSDSINPNKITFETVLDEEGMYRDVFEYVFYDDPAVHGEWRAYGVLMPDMDFTMLSVNDLRYNESMKDMLWQYLSVNPNGTIKTYDQNKKPYSVNFWTNGYHIKPDKNRQYVCRMFAVTLEDGIDYLLYEQKPTGNYRTEVPHRYLIYRREN